MKRAYFYFLFILFAFFSKAQDLVKYKYDNMLWGAYYNTINFKKDWKIVSDLQVRTKDWAENWSTIIIRAGLTRNLNDKFSVTAGLAHARYFISDVKTRGEWRPWEEVAYAETWKKWKIVNRIRIEQRFNETLVNNSPTGVFVFNHRFRFRLEIQYPLYKNENSQLVISLGNEVMLNAGKNIVYNYFDQNRSNLGLAYDVNKKLGFQVQYLYIWQQLSNGITLDKINVIRFNILHRINL